MSCSTSTAPRPVATTGATRATSVAGVRRGSTASSKARAGAAGEHPGELIDDARMADGLDVGPPGGVVLEPQHAARGVVDVLQLAGLVDDQHAFDHAAEDRLHARAIARQLVDAAAELVHGRVERARRDAEVVVSVVGAGRDRSPTA